MNDSRISSILALLEQLPVRGLPPHVGERLLAEQGSMGTYPTRWRC